jgi:glycosyltransferase involved in cell wall biosynthesis
LKVILAVDAIQAPLTGVGRYALELANRLQYQTDIEEVRYFCRWRFLDGIAQRRASATSPGNYTGAVRKLVKNRITSWLYGTFAPAIHKVGLASYKDYIYHSPNYYLPPFDGRTVVSFHDLSVYKYPECQPAARVAYMKRQIPLTLKRADFIISGSDFTRQEIIDFLGWPEDKIVSIPYGVGAEYMPYSEHQIHKPLSKIGLKPGGYSLCVGTIEPRKNILGLLRGFSRLPVDLQYRWPLVLVGARGWHSEETHSCIEQIQAKGVVRYLGYVPEGVLPFLFAGARAFLFPSFYEGFGIPVIEAMACGVPVMTSNRSSLPEISGGAAHLVTPEDDAQLTDGIRLVLEDEKWRNTTIPLGFEVARRYSWDSTVQQTVEVYRRLAI